LNGANQLIDGSIATSFFNLDLTGDGIKDLEANISTTNRLALFDATLKTNSQSAHHQNPIATSLTWGIGYIHTNELDGNFQQTTSASVARYQIPLGSPNLTNSYRPLILEPITTSNDIYAVNLADYSAENSFGTTTGGYAAPFSFDLKEVPLREFNENYFHTVLNISDPSHFVRVEIPYFNTDNISGWQYRGIAQFKQNTNQWEKTMVSSGSPSYPEFNFPNASKIAMINTYATDALVLSTTNIKVTQIVTPGNDNLNDYLIIDGLEDYEKNQLIIFDRWGNKVLDRTNYQNDWNGTNEVSKLLPFGDMLENDTYFYMLYLNDEEPLSGYFELLR
jgi:gliding motility-associated-like protein